jgi:nucleotide-binding universal stress UspA family protein
LTCSEGGRLPAFGAILRRVDGPAVHYFELGTDGPKVILVGVDGSETSMRAGAYAGGLARRQGARLVVLFVASPSRFASMSAAALAMLYQTTDEMAKELREMAESRAEELGIALTFVTRRGDPFVEMCRMATEIKADAIVVGASTWAGHRFAGSLAVRLVKAGRWPVTVVP